MTREDFEEMVKGYLEQLAYERLDGPIPDSWNPIAETTDNDESMARDRCLAFSETLSHNIPETAQWQTPAWISAGLLLAARDMGTTSLSFQDRVEMNEGISVAVADVADRELDNFVRQNPCEENSSVCSPK